VPRPARGRIHTHTQPRQPAGAEPEVRPCPNALAALPDLRTLRVEVLAGLVVALALIPEAISFSIIAGVDPRVGLYASFTMAVTIAFTGGGRR
jgi:SulP family sulfate permease